MSFASVVRVLSRALGVTLVVAFGVVALPSSSSADTYGHVTGTVTGPGGLPAQAVDVYMMHLDEFGKWVSVGSDNTDSQGQYEFWSQPGVHRLWFKPYLETSVYLPKSFPDAETIELGDDITVTGDSDLSFDIELDAGPHADLTGTIVGTNGSPVADAQIHFWIDKGTPESPWWVSQYLVKTDTQGHFHELIKPGSYRISYSRAGYVQRFYGGAASVETASDVIVEDGGSAQLDATLTRVTLISGKVVTADGSWPIPGTRVDFFRNTGTAATPTWSFAGSTSPDWNTGAYSKRLDPGTYVVRAVDPYGEYLTEYYNKAFATSTAQVLDLSFESTVASINFRMTRLNATPTAATSPPVITGSARVGATLATTAGAWSTAPVAVAYQWLSDGVAIPNAISATYEPTPGDLGHALSVRVRAYTPGWYPATQTSDPTLPVEPAPPVVVPAQSSSTTGIRVIKKVDRIKLIVTVKAATVVTGRVKVFRKARLLRSAALVSGKATFIIRNHPPGTWRYKVAYLGSPTVLASSKTLRITV